MPAFGSKLCRELKKIDIRTVFKSSASLKSVLCQNKSKVLPNSYPEVYQLQCSCQSRYLCETKNNISSSAIAHQQDGMKRKFESSGEKNIYHKSFSLHHGS